MREKRGFTLIELLVAVALLAILVTVAIPGFRTLIQNNRMTTQTAEVVSTLNYVRSEAIKRGTRVTLCKSNNGTACTAGAEWEAGWLIFPDTDEDGTVDGGESILRIHAPLKGGNTLRSTSEIASYISFVAGGSPRQINNDPQSGTLVLCDDRGFGPHARAVVISNSGQVRSTKATQSNVASCSP